MRYLISFPLVLALGACADLRPGFLDRPAPAPAPEPTPTAAPPPTGPVDPTAPVDPVGTGDPFAGGVTNPDENGIPTANDPVGDGRLGTTVASLGDPGEAGFWLKTPLVSTPTTGQVVYITSGRRVNVELRPVDGPAGGGSQISLAAMRLLDAPLTGLPELVVYANPA